MPSSTPVDTGSRKKRAILVGIGAHAHSWGKAIKSHPDWELAAVVDTDTEKLGQASQNWGVNEEDCFTTIEEVIQYGKGPYDCAIIVTPIYTHHVLALEAMDLGLNVILEKNLCSTIEQGRMLVKATVEHPQLCTATGTQSRYFAKNWTLKKYIQQHKQKLGEISSINAVCLYNWGKTRHGWRRWLEDLFLEDMAIHHLDYIRYVTGMDVVEIEGVNFKPKYSNFRGSSTTYAIMGLAKKENYYNRDEWIYGTYRGDWVSKGPLYDRYEVNCSGGRVVLMDKEVSAEIYDDEEGFKWHTDKVPLSSDVEGNPKNYTDQVYILDQMSIGIDSNGKIQPSTNFKEAFKSFTITMGLKESHRTGTKVFLPKYWENLPL